MSIKSESVKPKSPPKDQYAELLRPAEELIEQWSSIPRKRVKSSNLYSVGHNSPSKTMVIEFNNGSVYTFDNVPRTLYYRLLFAHSKGKFFHKHIKLKPAAFPYSRKVERFR